MIVETAPPAEPEEADLDEAGASEADQVPTEAPPKAPEVPPKEACEDDYFWESTAKYKDYRKGVGATQVNTNATSRTGKSSFTSEATGTVTVGVSGKLKTKASIAVAEIETEYSVNLSVSLTAKIGNTYTIDTPPHTTTNARCGVYRLKTAGYSQYHYANCTKGVKHNATLYSPHEISWYVWEAKA
ncbi:hypothetical protein V2W30_19595 [Streptomyces sp. Q6]|uniref:Uncharacterized protein n=1 Tax=Streptomyces citrinus TaxID=3118173 RepID=A0ACD5AHG8_9ACTN